MTAPPQGQPAPPRIGLRIEHDIPCPDCGYNLRGLRLDGRCPECGRPTIDTFARPLRAATGVMAELMIRRSMTLLLILLGWWTSVTLAGLYLSPELAFRMIVAASVLAAFGLVFSGVEAYRLRRQALGRQGGSSKPLQDVASLWLALCGLSILGGFLSMGLLGQVFELPAIGRTMLILGAAGAAAASHFIAARAAVTVLRRLALAAPEHTVTVAGIAQAALILACVAPSTGLAVVVTARIVVGVAALVTWLLASYRVIGKLQEAQGSVVSIGRRSRS